MMDGWMDGWVGGWADGWMDGWMDGRVGFRIAYSNQESIQFNSRDQIAKPYSSSSTLQIPWDWAFQ